MKSSANLLLVFVLYILVLGAGHSTKTEGEIRNHRIEKPPGTKTQSAGSVDTNCRLSKKKSCVKIATIGSRLLPLEPETEPQKVVAKMIAHWRSKFAEVLPDKPDLIVVPEACDEPAGFSLDKRLKYYRVRKNQVRDYFARVAKENNCYIVYSAVREMEDGSWRNSSVMLDRKGNISGIYNKNHQHLLTYTQN